MIRPEESIVAGPSGFKGDVQTTPKVFTSQIVTKYEVVDRKT